MGDAPTACPRPSRRSLPDRFAPIPRARPHPTRLPRSSHPRGASRSRRHRRRHLSTRSPGVIGLALGNSRRPISASTSASARTRVSSTMTEPPPPTSDPPAGRPRTQRTSSLAYRDVPDATAISCSDTPPAATTHHSSRRPSRPRRRAAARRSSPTPVGRSTPEASGPRHAPRPTTHRRARPRSDRSVPRRHVVETGPVRVAEVERPGRRPTGHPKRTGP